MSELPERSKEVLVTAVVFRDYRLITLKFEILQYRSYIELILF
jgi:hypothetical protein